MGQPHAPLAAGEARLLADAPEEHPPPPLVLPPRARQAEGAAAYLTGKLRGELGEHYSAEHFLPPYGPGSSGLCLVPDSDFFDAVKAGKASVVTGEIAGFEANAVQLTSGERIPADVVVTATGLRLALGGKIAISLDGEPVEFSKRWFYRGCMFSNLPNLAVVFGYLNASWTLRAGQHRRLHLPGAERDERGSGPTWSCRSCPRTTASSKPSRSRSPPATSSAPAR
jgi:cation diffusion facilitator CzcD-associated flavoprotein CzcO